MPLRGAGRHRVVRAEAFGGIGLYGYVDIIGLVKQNPRSWLNVSCPRSERRRVRASLVTTARRAGITITTQWEDRLGGLMWIREREPAATAATASSTLATT